MTASSRKVQHRADAAAHLEQAALHRGEVLGVTFALMAVAEATLATTAPEDGSVEAEREET